MLETIGTLEQLTDLVTRCNSCVLRAGATQTVPGVGLPHAKYLIIGEAPGREEDEMGVPFIGASGRDLNKYLVLANIDINDCYITNIVKCRPPKNRTPKKQEWKLCSQYLWEEIRLVDPEVIITVGSTPLALFSDEGITQLHGTMFEWKAPWGKTFKVIAHYHPAACFHAPRLKAVLLNDWEFCPKIVRDEFIFVEPTRSNFPHYIGLDTENDIGGSLSNWSIAYRKGDEILVEPYCGVDKKVRFGDSIAVIHNAKHDLRVLKRHGMDVPTKYECTMIGAYCLGLGRQAEDKDENGDTGMVGGLGLKYLARRRLGMQMNSWMIAKEFDADGQKLYNARDSVAHLLLGEDMRPVMPEHYYTIDMPLLPVLMRMEDNGIMVDRSKLQVYKESLAAEMATISLPLNPQSPLQVANYVYGTLGITPTVFAKSGAPSTGAEALETIDDPVVDEILRWRGLHTEYNNFAKNYLSRLTLEDRIHPTFKQTSTATGRLSCAEPNLQNPSRTSDIRTMFIAPPRKTLVCMDYKQLELYVIAAITQDPKLLTAALAQVNFHQNTADETGFEYHDAKTLNYLMTFGGGEYKISQQFHVPMYKAKEIKEHYFETYPGLQKYMLEQEGIAKREKKVTNYFGRVRRLDAMFAGNYKTQQEGIREAINTPIQGTAGDIVKRAMIRLDKEAGYPMLLQVHDELLFEVPTRSANEFAHWLKDFVPTITEIKGVTFPIDVGIGKSWKDAKHNTI